MLGLTDILFVCLGWWDYKSSVLRYEWGNWWWSMGLRM